MTPPDPAAGQTWRSLGKAGHPRQRITVLKRTAGGKVVVTGPNRRATRSQIRTMSLDVFLNNYVPEHCAA